MSDFGSARGLAAGVLLALLAGVGVGLALFGDFNADSGGLEQLPGTAACLSVDGSGGFADGAKGGECAVAVALAAPSAIAISPDGRNAYVAAHREALVVLDRDPRSGALTQKRGPAGCHSFDGTPGGIRARRLQLAPAQRRAGACARARGLFGIATVSVSRDGRSVVAGSADGLALFAREPATGALRQLAGAAGCATAAGSVRMPAAGSLRRTRVRCTTARELFDANSIAIAADGRTAYAASAGVVALARAPRDGALRPPAGARGCLSVDGRGASRGSCVAAPLIDGVSAIELSGDGRSLYAAVPDDGAGDASRGRVALLRRTGGGALAPVAAPRGCVSAGDRRCTRAAGLRGAAAIALAPGGRQLYAVATLGCALVVLDRAAGDGALTARSGAAAGSVEHGERGACTNRTGNRPPGPIGGDVALDGDGRRVFVASSVGVAMFERDARDGSVRYAGCVSDDGESTCADARALSAPIDLAVSPDGRHLYVATRTSNAIAAFAIPR